jgi:hypothetical protein
VKAQRTRLEQTTALFVKQAVQQGFAIPVTAVELATVVRLPTTTLRSVADGV